MIALVCLLLCMLCSGVAFRYNKIHQNHNLRQWAASDQSDPPGKDLNQKDNLIPPEDRPTGRYVPVTELDDVDLNEPDEELEQDMAIELYNTLRGPEEGLSLQRFFDWDDIQEVLERGVLDKESITIIVREVGVKSDIMNFNQFQEVVDLINQLSTTLEAEELINDSDDDEEDLAAVDDIGGFGEENENDKSFSLESFEIWRERPAV